jgi:protein TonB
MAFATPDRGAFTRRQQLGPLVLTILLHIIVVALLLFYKGAPVPRMVEQSLKTIFLPPAKEESEEPAKAETKQERKTEDSAASEPPANPEPPVEPPKAPEPPPIPIGPNWLTMSRADFAASDISKMARVRKGSDPGPAADSTSAYGPGDGPGGAQLYDPDWFRRPTHAELDGYLAASMPSKGWGLIACQTIPRNRVDNCRTLGEFPLGSGFGKAVRDAAWQFQVLPPRINGKPMIGAWVRIRITYGDVDEAG